MTMRWFQLLASLKDPAASLLRAGARLFTLAGIVLTATLAVNGHCRFIFMETWSHYVYEQIGATAVICGDSIGAGGRHWSALLGLMPLRTRNLAGNGYTIRQVVAQVRRSREYRPRFTIVYAGTNYAFSILAGELTIAKSLEHFGDLVASMPEYSTLLYVLPPPTRQEGLNQISQELRASILNVAPSPVIVVDVEKKLADADGLLLRAYSIDGVHLTAEGYEVISAQIRIAMRSGLASYPERSDRQFGRNCQTSPMTSDRGVFILSDGVNFRRRGLMDLITVERTRSRC